MHYYHYAALSRVKSCNLVSYMLIFLLYFQCAHTRIPACPTQYILFDLYHHLRLPLSLLIRYLFTCLYAATLSSCPPRILSLPPVLYHSYPIINPITYLHLLTRHQLIDYHYVFKPCLSF